LPDIYACYERSQGHGTPAWRRAFHNVHGTRPCPRITFIGVWDTVGALGAPGFLGQLFNRNKYRYHQVCLNRNIQNAYQALAIDERRKPFAPNLWERPSGWGGALEQAWFPGVHSDVGGSLPRGGLANEALHWMVEKAQGLGLEFDDRFLAYYRPCFNSILHNSMTVGYRLLGQHLRTIGSRAAGDERLHQATLDRFQLRECAYAPSNLQAYLANAGTVQTWNTTRIARGAPCPDE